MKRNVNGSGCISRRKDGRYMGKIVVDGISKCVYGKSEREVSLKMQEWRVSKTEPVSNKRFDSYFSYWIENVKRPTLKTGSYQRLKRTYENHIRPAIGSLKLSKLTTADIQSIINEMASKYSYSTVKKVAEAVSACLSHAVACRDLPYSPASAVVVPTAGHCAKATKELQIPSDEEIKKLFETAEAYLFSDAYKLLALTGMRQGELLALKWDDYSPDKKTLRIDETVAEVKDTDGRYVRILQSPKTKSSRRLVALNPAAIEVVESIFTANKNAGFGVGKDDFIVLNHVGKSPSCHDLQRTLTRVCKAAGVKPFSPHAFRHYFASKCIENGCEMIAISRQLGHSRPSITADIYAHVTEKVHADFVDKISKFNV